MGQKLGKCRLDVTSFVSLLVMTMQTINAACRVMKDPKLQADLPAKLLHVARDCARVFTEGRCLYGRKIRLKKKTSCRLDLQSFADLVKSLRANIESSLLLEDPALEPELIRRHLEIIADCAIIQTQTRCVLAPSN